MLKYIESKIKEQPSSLLTYAQFINIALYDETYGYYMRNNKKIGTDGDFITASNIYNVYGQIVGKWYAQIYKKFNLKQAICEIGGGNGRFAEAFLKGWYSQTKEQLTYYIVETSPYHRKLQQEKLPIGTEVIQVNQVEQLAPFSGLIFSNELYDALPVHVIKKNNGKLYEVMVGINDGKLKETEVLLTNKRILKFLAENDYMLQDGQTIEIPLAMENMIKSIANTVEKGIFVTVDYGYTKDEWQDESRRNGSLRGYYKHKLVENVLQHVGEMDITSHVHFDPFITMGEQNELSFITKQKLNEFLLHIGILEQLQEHNDSNPFSEVNRQNRAIRSLIMSSMSEMFHVIVQQKGCEVTKNNLFNNDNLLF